ncbi:hypothetical protein PhCBS80983_g02756 [Powellomyces hirtus]|uniref:TRUD domain-containing protein n=1 Tax=Powellomyces hirtus TaxID=109895 RepID=A0A507E6L7_9FUNG|nr:hypothetical protein PhCBS80983_g02756 [Powellomyces hirtus]
MSTIPQVADSAKRPLAGDDVPSVAEDDNQSKRARKENVDDEAVVEAEKEGDAADPSKTAVGTSDVTARKVLKEEDVGITAYIAPELKGFTGILKSRYTDFQVNEVTPDGQIVHLVSTVAPAAPEAAPEPSAEVKEVNEDQVYVELGDLIGDDTFIQNLKKMVADIKASRMPVTKQKDETIIAETPAATDATSESLIANTTSTPAPALPEPLTANIPTKETRTKIHMCVKQHFGSLIDTQGAEGGDLVFRAKTNEKRGARNKNDKKEKGGKGKGAKNSEWRRYKTKDEWDAAGGQYTEFTLYKENVDTMNAISKIASLLRLRNKAFSYAGSKDKRAVTTQKVAISRIPPSRLAAMNKGLRGMSLGDFRMRKEQITLGELKGNHFKIALRDVECESVESVEVALQSLRDYGFINYFGMQRFGTRSLPTYAVGIAYLNGEFEKAVNYIMEPKDGDRQDVQEARLLWMTQKDAAGALKGLPKHCLAERSVLGYFKSKDRHSDFLGALEAIPRNLRTMYLHSYQSLVWNHMASERLRLYGRKPVVGDLVDVTPSDTNNTTADDIDDMDLDPENEIEADVTDTQPENSKRREVIVKLIETDQEAATYDMAQVVLPMPGHQIQYPTHAIRELYSTFMSTHGVDPFNMVRKHKTASLPGSYRRILGKAADFAWQILRYTDPEQDLMLTDMDRVQGKPEPVSLPDGARLGVVVEFTLGSSQYATMALRECTKMATAAGHHEEKWTTSQNRNAEAGKS